MKVNVKLGGINAVIAKQFVTWMDKEPFMVLGERAFSPSQTASTVQMNVH